MNRRGFLASMLALGAAPAIVRASSLMKVKPILMPGEDFVFFQGKKIYFDDLPQGTIYFSNRIWGFEGRKISYSKPMDPEKWQ